MEHKSVGLAGDGVVETAKFNHTLFLGGVFADTPARDKAAKWAGVAAYLCCGYCIFQATRCVPCLGLDMLVGTQMSVNLGVRTVTPDLLCRGPNGGMYPEGYHRPAPQPLLFPQVQHGMFMDDARLKLSHNLHMKIAKLVEARKVTPKKAGRRGVSAIIRALPYTHYANLFVVPVAHALLLGIVKTFWNTVLAKVS